MSTAFHLDLPEIHQSTLSAEQLSEYLVDLEVLADRLRIFFRAKMGAEAQELESLSQAANCLESLERGSVRLEYDYDNTSWSDTLLAKAGALTLVRIARPR